MQKIKVRLIQFRVFVKYLFAKLITLFYNSNKYEELWLVSERGDDARDNGYCFYMFLKQNHPDINFMFVIDSKSADYAKFEEDDRLIQFGSFEHYVAIIKAKYLISTHIMGFTPQMNLFMKIDRIRGLSLKGKKIFLQHGITKDKAKLNFNIDLMVCGAKKEYDYLQTIYPEMNLKYTGFARYDQLKNCEEKMVLVMPTWRLYIDSETKLKRSQFFNKYQSLLNNKTLSDYLKKYGFKLYFYPHYELQKYIHLFKTDLDNIVVCSLNDYDVASLLMKTKLLITDYSSVFFDVGYLDKPVIYYQFDKDEYRLGHYEEGYFNYERDGFGPVVYNESELTFSLEKILSSGCRVDSEYKIRQDEFFKLRDYNNCNRIFSEIIKL